MRGRIVIAGIDVTELTETELATWRSQNIGFIFQFYNLIPVLTTVENVELPLILTPLSKKERRAHAEAASKSLGWLSVCTTTHASYPAVKSSG
jgi:putative ABC transport system ATP-binding protein